MAAQTLVFQSKCNVLFMMSDFECSLMDVCIYTFLSGSEPIYECMRAHPCVCEGVCLYPYRFMRVC